MQKRRILEWHILAPFTLLFTVACYISVCDHLITVSVTNSPIDSGQDRVGNALSLVSMLSLGHCRAPPQIQQIHLLDYFDYFLL